MFNSNKLFVLLTLVALVVLTPLTSAAWDNSSYLSRLVIPINVSQGSTPQNYPVLINVTYRTGMNANFSDLLFYNTSGTTTLPFWIESSVPSSYANVWVKVQNNITTTAQNIYGYYGCPTCSVSASNGYKTFDLFDDFRLSKQINNTIWYNTSSVTAGIGEINLTSGNLTSKTAFTVNYSVRGNVSIDATAGGDVSVGWGGGQWGISRAVDYVRLNPTATGVYANSYHTAGTSTTKFFPTGAFYVFEAQRNSIISNIFTASNGSTTTHTGAAYVAVDATAASSQLYTGIDFYSSGGGATHASWWLIRKYQSPEPAAQTATVETTSIAMVTLNSPSNTTYVNSTVTGSYTYTNSQNFAGQCFEIADSTTTNLGIIQAIGTNTRTVASTKIGQVSLNYTCSEHAPANASVDAPTEEGSGSTTQDLMNNSNFTLKSGVSWAGTANAPNGYGNALNFTDSNSGAESSVNPAIGLGNFTYGAWFYGNSNCGTGWNCNSTTPRILDTDSINIFLGSNTTGTQSCQANNATGATLTATTGAFAKKKWNRIECVFSNNGATGNVTVYVNGVYNATASSNGFGNLKSSLQKFRIGQGSSLARSWDGMIAKVTAYNRALNSTEISELYTLGTSGYTNRSAETTYTRLDWLVNGNGYTTPIYETTNQAFTGSINTTTNVAIVSATLFYNSTNQGVNTSVTQTAYQSNTSKTIAIPLLQVNNTNVTLYWSYVLSWSNGTTIVVNTTTQTQSILYGYVPGTFYLSSSSTGESQSVNATLSVTNYTDTATVSVVNYLNSSIYGAGVWSNSNYTTDLTTPFIGQTSVTLYPFASFNVSFNGYSRVSNSSNLTLAITQLSLNNCSNSTTYGVNFTFKDEEPDGNTDLNGTMGGTFTITDSTGTLSRAYNFSWVNVTTASVCISPANSNVYVTSDQDYYGNYNASYPVRHYYLSNASINTTTATNLNLYLLSDARAYLTEYTLQTQAGLPVEGYTVQVTRYYPSRNQYLLIGMGKTDSNGNTGVYLRPNDVAIRVYAYQNDTLIETFTPAPVTCTPVSDARYGACTVTLILTGEALESSGKIAGVTGSCENTTVADISYISCIYSDPTASLSRARLVVWELGGWANTTTCDTSSTSASGALSCTLGNLTATGKSYQYAFSTAFSPPGQKYGGFVITTPHPDNYGSFGALLSALIVLGIGLSGTINPPLTIVGTLIGFTFAYVIGFTFIAWPAFIGLLIVGVIAIYSASK